MSKKLSAGAVITCIAAVFSLVGVILYQINISSAGYFQNGVVSQFLLTACLPVVLFLLAVLLGSENVGKALLSGICQIAAPALIAFSLINLVSARAEGLAYLFFSNEDVSKEIQTVENMTSARIAIAAMIVLGLAMLFGIIGAFTSMRKKNA